MGSETKVPTEPEEAFAQRFVVSFVIVARR